MRFKSDLRDLRAASGERAPNPTRSACVCVCVWGGGEGDGGIDTPLCGYTGGAAG